MSAPADLRRLLPSVEQVLQRTEVRALEARHGRALVVRELRALVEDARARAAAGDRAAVESVAADLPAKLAARLDRARAASLVPVINATGVVVHTNLGRSRLPPEAAEQVARIATSYSNLEFDLAGGERGQREVHAETRLRALVGAEAAVVVNNNAAAVLLAVNTFAEGREVLVSRSELVEIGGSFRIPDVLRKGGARLREVGTTNRTRIADYRAALGPDTGLVLKVHPSNFRIVGYTEAPSRPELVALAREAGVPMVEDLGSGLLVPLAGLDETTVAESLRGGVDVVTFSGDKLLGGPQAGLVVGGESRVGAMRANPLYRALRVDKMTLAALDAILLIHESGRATMDLPTARMLSASVDEVRARATAFAARLSAEAPSLTVALADGTSAAGGGAAPTAEIPTVLLRLVARGQSPQQVAAALRTGAPPVVARVADDALVLDLRTVATDEEDALAGALTRASTTATEIDRHD
ncbi:MAG TPA: L-seryl-tRNA(Sec) selenium transferase [Vicinamibacteria bacterium]|nr:L-seryl-tRNA(Sec) selenium transferase [Vicinamibacteria bacterium]